jgi:hypothetical protein
MAHVSLVRVKPGKPLLKKKKENIYCLKKKRNIKGDSVNAIYDLSKNLP